MMTGAQAVAEFEGRNSPPSPRHLLFLDGDLEDTASEAGKLVTPEREGRADMTIAVLPAQKTAGGGHGLVVRLARSGVVYLTGFRHCVQCVHRQMPRVAIKVLAAGPRRVERVHVRAEENPHTP